MGISNGTNFHVIPRLAKQGDGNPRDGYIEIKIEVILRWITSIFFSISAVI